MIECEELWPNDSNVIHGYNVITLSRTVLFASPMGRKAKRLLELRSGGIARAQRRLIKSYDPLYENEG